MTCTVLGIRYNCLENLDGSVVRPLINGIQAKIDETPLPLTVAVAGGTGSGTEITKSRGTEM